MSRTWIRHYLVQTLLCEATNLLFFALWDLSLDCTKYCRLDYRITF
jgi:hypothetical protein